MRSPAVGRVAFGDLRRLEPISREWGFDRGRPIDRYYIERFLHDQAATIAGRVLEIGDDQYTRRFGADRVHVSDVLHVSENAKATIVADLTSAPQIPSDTFDCLILCQTLQLIFDPGAAVRTIHRVLKNGGVVLATFPGITQRSDPAWRDTWYWSFTSSSARRLFGGVFGDSHVEVTARGNVLTAVAFLHGLALEELTESELEFSDPDYEFLITVRAAKHPPNSPQALR